MTDIKTAKAGYDCRDEVAKCLGQPISRGVSWVWSCPFHQERTPGGFHVFANGYNCFACGEHGDVFDWIAWWQKIPLATALHTAGVEMNPERAIEMARKAEVDLAASIAKAQQALDNLRSARKWEQYHEQMTEQSRDLYRLRGIPDWYQDYLPLGYCPDFRVWYNDQEYHTPSLTIPVYKPGRECVNIRHRLLTPPDNTPGNKYRPEQSGLGSHLFLADPERAVTGNVLVVEGEFKAAVSWVTMDDASWQVVGLPGKAPKADLIDQLKQTDAVVCLDPDAETEAKELAQTLKGRVVYLPFKIDDGINEHGLDKEWLRSLMRTARKV